MVCVSIVVFDWLLSDNVPTSCRSFSDTSSELMHILDYNCIPA